MSRKTSKRAGVVMNVSRVPPQALSRLELLIGERVMDLRAISDVLRSDSSLMASMVQWLHECDEMSSAFPSVEECIVELGLEGMRTFLRNARASQPGAGANQN